jgi:glycosyltransferase involved in cell wall biosynthesis
MTAQKLPEVQAEQQPAFTTDLQPNFQQAESFANQNGQPVAEGRPKVTFGLPVYNGELFISRTLDSLLAQTYQDFEIVICDNASTDRTSEIICNYAARDNRIRSYRNERNMGATYNYNRVLELASGEYFKWIAADDVIRPEFLTRCVEELDSDPSVVLAYSKAAFIDEDDRVIYRFDDVMTIQNWPAPTVARTNQILEAIFRNGSAANVIVFGLARTEALRAIRPLGNYFGPDFTIVTEMALHGKIQQVSGVLAFYRRHGGSSSTYRRTPSAAGQQEFLDPSITGRFRQEFQLRRRYFEVFRAIVKSDISLGQRLAIASTACGFIVRRAGWRLSFELRSLLGQPDESLAVKRVDGIGRHWSEFA